MKNLGNPGLHAIIGLNALAGYTAVRALLRETGKLGQIDVMAMDRDRDTLIGIKEGKIVDSVVQTTHLHGFLSLATLYFLNHDVVPMFPDWRKFGLELAPMSTEIDTGVFICTKDNVDQVMRAGKVEVR